MTEIFYPPATECIGLGTKPTLVIGSRFQNDIYYQYNDLILPRHGILYFEGDELYYREYDNKGNVKGRPRMLEYEAELRVEGLYIINLGKYLALTGLYGQLRISGRREYVTYGRI